MDTFVLVVFAVGPLLQLALVTTSPSDSLPYACSWQRQFSTVSFSGFGLWVRVRVLGNVYRNHFPNSNPILNHNPNRNLTLTPILTQTHPDPNTLLIVTITVTLILTLTITLTQILTLTQTVILNYNPAN